MRVPGVASPIAVRRLAIVAVVALGARLAVVAATPGYRPLHDDASYARVARSLLTVGRYPIHHLPGGGWQEGAYRPPGWPGALWATWSVTGRSVLAGSALAVAGMWAARGRGVPLGFWLLLGALFVLVALVNGELRLGAPARALALVFGGLGLSTLGASAHARRERHRRAAVPHWPGG